MYGMYVHGYIVHTTYILYSYAIYICIPRKKINHLVGAMLNSWLAKDDSPLDVIG